LLFSAGPGYNPTPSLTHLRFPHPTSNQLTCFDHVTPSNLTQFPLFSLPAEIPCFKFELFLSFFLYTLVILSAPPAHHIYLFREHQCSHHSFFPCSHCQFPPRSTPPTAPLMSCSSSLMMSTSFHSYPTHSSHFFCVYIILHVYIVTFNIDFRLFTNIKPVN
jgi:hypothetical protein